MLECRPRLINKACNKIIKIFHCYKPTMSKTKKFKINHKKYKILRNNCYRIKIVNSR